MRLTISGITFFMVDKGGHIYRESAGRTGTIGEQICRANGCTVQSTPDLFARDCRRYIRYLKRRALA